jgi:hypothetical protein
MLTCLFDPIGCVQTTLAGWIASIPLEWLLGAVFVLGMMVGAAVGRWGVAAILGGLALITVFSNRTPDRHQVEIDGNDARPNSDFVMFPKKARPKVKLRGKRYFDTDTNTWKDS